MSSRPWEISECFNNDDFDDEVAGLATGLSNYRYEKNSLQRIWSWLIGEAVIIDKILVAADLFHEQARNQNPAAAWTFFQKLTNLSHKNAKGLFAALRHELGDLLHHHIHQFEEQAQTNYALLKKGSKSKTKPSTLSSWLFKPSSFDPNVAPYSPADPDLPPNTPLKDRCSAYTAMFKEDRVSKKGSKGSNSHASKMKA